MLRPYQQESTSEASHALFKENLRSVIIQGPTGTGKTPIASHIANQVLKNNLRIWIIVPRIDLIGQTSKHFRKWGVTHGIIAPGHREMSVYKVHIVSKDTLPRRIAAIKNPPDIIMIDECHLSLDFQIWLAAQFPHAKIVGFTATPERLDGRGLSTKSGGIYDKLIMSHPIPWFVERGYLTDLDYYAPPADSEIDKMHTSGTDLNKKEFDAYVKKRKIYGEAIDHYEKFGKGKPGIIFNHSVQAAYEQADEFRKYGIKAYCIEGKTKKGDRKSIIEALHSGDIDILTNRDIATYGIDIPNLEYGALLRYTLSLPLYMQMIGRLIRPFEIKEGNNVKYRKEIATVFDHVGVGAEHVDPDENILPHYSWNLKWDFYGTAKKKRKTPEEKLQSLRYCPFCGLYSKTPQKCSKCGEAFSIKQKKAVEVVDTELVKMAKPAKFNELPEEEKREHIDSVNSCIVKYRDAINAGDTIAAGPIGELLNIAKKRGYKPLWVYNTLVPKEQKTCNVTLLHEIARQSGYKPAWVRFAKEKIFKEKW